MRSLYRLFSNTGRQKRNTFALDNLDKKLEAFIPYSNGVFIEAGANDGISQSNTLYFEKYKNWTGLLVEPIPELAEKARRNRQECIVEQVALTSFEDNRTSVTMQYCNLMSLVKGSRPHKTDEVRHLQHGQKFLAPEEEIYSIEVPANTLSSLIDSHNLKNIDLLSLDVEGYEGEALKGLDFARHRPKFMLIEVWDRIQIDSILANYYSPVATLSSYENRCDILYKLR